MKKIDKLLLGAFAGPFVMTFLVVVFILLTQHMLKYFDDIIGKGLGGEVIGQLLFYFAIFMTPVALPLAVLLSSLIAFGNLGEHFELTAIKSSGISLVRALRPIFFLVLVLTVIAFYANNNLVPKAALEAYSLLYDIKQKKPALDLREGAFFNGISDISIKVNKKFEDGITLKDVIVYDHRKNDGNKEVTVADSGRMYTILNERYLKFELFKGYRYTEGASGPSEVSGKGRSKTESMTRSKFDKTQIVYDLSSIQFTRTEKKWFQGNRIMRNLGELNSDMDSIHKEILSQRLNYYQYTPSYFAYYRKGDTLEMPAELKQHQHYKDSLVQAKFSATYNTPGTKKDEPTETAPMAATTPEGPIVTVAPADVKTTETMTADAAKAKAKGLAAAKKKQTVAKKPTRKPVAKSPSKASKPKKQSLAKSNSSAIKEPKELKESKTASIKSKDIPVEPDSITKAKERIRQDSLLKVRLANIDSIFAAEPNKDNFSGATNSARQIKTNVENTNASAESYEKEMVIFEIQWHKILASSLACVAMFLIGAPLGAIIKKGGLGMPFLVSILFFIIYYVITMQGEKLAKTGAVSPLVGVWMADGILLMIGLFFLRQARADARLFEADFYSVVFDKVKTWFKKRKEARIAPAG